MFTSHTLLTLVCSVMKKVVRKRGGYYLKFGFLPGAYGMSPREISLEN